MASLKDLPPTALGIAPTPNKVERLTGEILALRILLAGTIWKAGGTVTLTNEEITYVAANCRLDTDPIPGGQILSLSTPLPADALVLPPGVLDV